MLGLSDTISGGDGYDIAGYEDATVGVNIDLGHASTTWTGDAQGAILTSIEEIDLSGFADTFRGDANANIVSGGFGDDGQAYNINADVVAGKIAEILHAEKLIMMTNIAGVQDKQGKLLTDLSAREIDEMFADGTISGGMLPKISSALDAAKSGVNTVHIIDGRIEHSLLLEVLTEQAFGTMIRSH